MIVLTLTSQASSQIRGLIDRPDLPDTTGLRIATDPASSALTLSLAAVPGEDDQILDDAGARVYLDAQAAQLLDDQVLDVATSADGRVGFSLESQQS